MMSLRHQYLDLICTLEQSQDGNGCLYSVSGKTNKKKKCLRPCPKSLMYLYFELDVSAFWDYPRGCLKGHVCLGGLSTEGGNVGRELSVSCRQKEKPMTISISIWSSAKWLHKFSNLLRWYGHNQMLYPSNHVTCDSNRNAVQWLHFFFPSFITLAETCRRMMLPTGLKKHGSITGAERKANDR